MATIQEVMNLMLLGGHIGRPGAGPCPVRGHSNVQGDRTMGIWERMNDKFMEKLGEEFHFTPPAEHGTDTVETLKHMHQGLIRVFFGMGGNFSPPHRTRNTRPPRSSAAALRPRSRPS